MVTEADALLKNGDVLKARLSYEKAWTGGSPDGAFGMARSYDPVVLGSLAVRNDNPDKEKALAWYERAAGAGHAGAADAIVRLRLKR
jgi:TPR repeat protein